MQQKIRSMLLFLILICVVSAFQLHVSGYLMKPITPEAVQKEIDHIKGVKATEELLTIKCFGNFEVLHNGEVLPFKRKKAK